MFAFNRRFFVLCLCMYILFAECLGGGGGGKSGGKSSGKSSKSQGAKGFLGDPAQNSKTLNGGIPKTKTAGRFFSAWGIITLIMFIILGSALIYYTSIFYPLVCAERGKYDVMEMTSV